MQMFNPTHPGEKLKEDYLIPLGSYHIKSFGGFGNSQKKFVCNYQWACRDKSVNGY